MSNPPSSLEEAAFALRQARKTRQPIASISNTYSIVNIEQAYSVAAINISRCVENGKRIIGKKVGLTSLAVQQQLGVNEPDFGLLLEGMEVLNNETVSLDTLIQPRVEAEIAFVMSSDLGSHIPSWGEFVSNIACALPALEIVDSAIAEWKINLFDTIADNASCALYVLGDQPVSVSSTNLSDVPMSMTCNGHLVSSGTGTACLGNPLRAAYWLAATMSRRGEPLKAGETILSGALGPMVSVSHGQYVQASFGPLGHVGCFFE